MKNLYKKIKEKIKQKPKLVKVLKLFKLIINLFCYLITLFTIVSLVVGGACAKTANSVDNLRNTHKNIAYRDNYYMISYNETLTLKALDSVRSWALNEQPYLTDWANGVANTNYYYNLLQDYPVGISPSDNMDNTFYIDQIGSSGQPQPIFNARLIRFYSTTQYFTYWGRKFWFIGFGNDGNREEYGFEFFVHFGIQGCTSIPSTGADSELFSCRIYHRYADNSYEYSIDTLNYSFSFLKDSTPYRMFRALIEGTTSNEDYGLGYSTGYGQGYSDGYYDGNNDLSVNGANPFQLISQSFESVAAILDIKILPYLSIGTLLFTPLIIAIIVVIVKMIKG